MSKYIKAYNDPFIRVQCNYGSELTRIYNINEIVEIEYWDNRAYIYFKSGLNHEIGREVAEEIDEFLMNHSITKTNILGTVVNIDMMHEEQTLEEWLEEDK